VAQIAASTDKGGDEPGSTLRPKKLSTLAARRPVLVMALRLYARQRKKVDAFPRLKQRIGMRRNGEIPKIGGQFRAFPPCLSVEAPKTFSKDLAGFGRLKRQIGRCLTLSRLEMTPSPFGSGGRCLPALPIAHTPIGKARPCGFGSRPRNTSESAAPESLPTKSEIGDGR